MASLPVGSHIKVSRRVYDHHGVYIGRGRVVHFSGEPGRKADASIREDSLETFLAGGRLEIVAYGRRVAPKDAVRRARSRVGERGYHLIFRNCEHFAVWCCCGRHASEQVVDRAATVGGASGTAAATAGAIGVVSGVGAATGLSGAGVMSGLATVGTVVGGGAAAGLAALGAAPGVVATVAMRRVLEDRPELPARERRARAGGRVATVVGAAAGTSGAVGAVAMAGSVAGLSGAGITSGLAAIGATVGGGMVGGVAVTVAAPALAAAAVGYGAYRLIRWLWLGAASSRVSDLPLVRVHRSGGRRCPLSVSPA